MSSKKHASFRQCANCAFDTTASSDAEFIKETICCSKCDFKSIRRKIDNIASSHSGFVATASFLKQLCVDSSSIGSMRVSHSTRMPMFV